MRGISKPAALSRRVFPGGGIRSGFNFLFWHKEKQKKLIQRIGELRELSGLAAEAGAPAVYQSLQKEANELLMEYLALCFIDGIYFLLPHVLVLAVLSHFWPVVNLPDGAPFYGWKVSSVVWYPVLVIMYYLGKNLIRHTFKKQK